MTGRTSRCRRTVVIDFDFSPGNLAVQGRVRNFMQRRVLPSNRDWHRWADEGEFALDVVDPIKAQAKASGF